SVKLRWDVNVTTGDRAKWGMIYNDEANIDHFELVYKDGEKGRVSEVGRTTSWSGYVGNIPMEDATQPYVGVRAVSIDGKSYSNTVWVEIPRAPKSTLPEALSASGNYPAIILDNSSDGITSALNNRYLTKFKVENSDADFLYENYDGTPYMVDIKNGVEDKNADKTNYIFAEDNTIKVHQGQTFKCSFEFQTQNDALWYCVGRGYADWDCSEGFDASTDELVLKLGEDNCKHKIDEMTSPYSWEIKVPEDAVPGKSRLRLVFSDAWFAHPGAAGAHNKGFAIDFPMEITGDNESRKPAVDTHDQGISDQPIGFDKPDVIINAKEGASEFAVNNGQIDFKNVDKVWIYTTDGRLVNFQTNNVKSVPTEGLSGTYLIRMQSGQVMRTRKIAF
ncbi:MAG: T9SS type A sorting domain-containing protein, partial [Bacteroidaceae bacterium]|nr:T9SS type A sorting domain-containing protein [Bacteroidaceae bacterium]